MKASCRASWGCRGGSCSSRPLSGAGRALSGALRNDPEAGIPGPRGRGSRGTRARVPGGPLQSPRHRGRGGPHRRARTPALDEDGKPANGRPGSCALRTAPAWARADDGAAGGRRGAPTLFRALCARPASVIRAAPASSRSTPTAPVRPAMGWAVAEASAN